MLDSIKQIGPGPKNGLIENGLCKIQNGESKMVDSIFEKIGHFRENLKKLQYRGFRGCWFQKWSQICKFKNGGPDFRKKLLFQRKFEETLV